MLVACASCEVEGRIALLVAHAAVSVCIEQLLGDLYVSRGRGAHQRSSTAGASCVHRCTVRKQDRDEFFVTGFGCDQYGTVPGYGRAVALGAGS